MRNLIARYWQSQGFKKLFFNTSWLLSDKVLKITAGLFVGILVARYLGPEQYGTLAYAMSLVTMIAMLNHLGLDGLAVRELVKHPQQETAILGTAFCMKLGASLIATFIVVAVAWLSEDRHSETFYLLLIMAAYCLFEPKIVAHYWFQSRLQARYASWSNSLSLLIVSLAKLVLVFLSMGLLWFGAMFVLEACLIFVLSFYFLAKVGGISFSQFTFDRALAKSLFSRGWMVMIAAIFAAIYKKIDQAMLMWMASETDVGTYAIAAQLSDLWAFVPMAIVASVFPTLVKTKDADESLYQRRMQQVFDLLAFLAFGLAIATTLIATPLITIMYGEAFIDTADILVIHIWSNLFVFFRALFGRWIHLEQVFVFSVVTQAIGAIFNVVLNLWLIPLYSGYGAAIATLVSYGMASFVSLAFHSRSRPIFFMMCKSLLIVFRGPALIKQLSKKEF